MNWSYSAWYRWIAQADGGTSFGMCSSDTFHLGLRSGTVKPCPNGMEMDCSTRATNPAWRARIEKAKRDIERIQQEHRVTKIAATVPRSAVKAFLKALR